MQKIDKGVHSETLIITGPQELTSEIITGPFKELTPDFLIGALFDRMLFTELVSLKLTCKYFSQTINCKTLNTYCIAVKEFKLNIYVLLKSAPTDKERAQVIANCAEGSDEIYNPEISLVIQNTFKRSARDVDKLSVLKAITPILAPVCPEGLVKLAQSYGSVFSGSERFAEIGRSIGNHNFKKTIAFIDQSKLSDRQKIDFFSNVFFYNNKLVNPDAFKIDENVIQAINYICKYGYFDYYGGSEFHWIGAKFLSNLAREIMATDLKLAEKIVRSIQKFPYDGKKELYTDLILAMRESDFKNAIDLLCEANFHLDPLWNQRFRAKILKKTLFKHGRLFIPLKVSNKEFTNIVVNCALLCKKPTPQDHKSLGISSKQFKEMIDGKDLRWVSSCATAEYYYERIMKICNEDILHPMREYFLSIGEETGKITTCLENEYKDQWLPWSQYVREYRRTGLTDEMTLV